MKNKKDTNVDYFEGVGRIDKPLERESLSEIYEHLEELKKNPPKSKAGKVKLKFYQNEIKKYK